MRRAVFIGVLSGLLWLTSAGPASAQTAGKQPVTVNGDTVEFLAEGREVVASGHVEIVYKEATLRCDSVRVFIDEKIALAEGNVSFVQPGAQELRGETIIYDFGTQSGTVIEPEVKFPPYYGGARLMEKISETEYLLERARVSTCDLPHPHYALTCREIKMDPKGMMHARGVKLSIGNVPFLYLPVYAQMMTDKKPRFMIIPGHKKDFGTTLFGSYRYYMNANARGLLHLDWYEKKGWAEGVDLNYDTKLIGRGQVKYYRIDEKNEVNDETKERSRLELRHRWDLTPADSAVLEYFRASNATFRKDYFFREYEKEPNPRSFFQYAHVFPNATVSLLSEPRVNSFESKVQRIPELRLETTNMRVGTTPFYFKNSSSSVLLSQAMADTAATKDVGRIDTTNQVSRPFRFSFIDFNPYAGHRDTFYSRGLAPDERIWRGMFFTGLDMSTRFFRLFNVSIDKGGLQIDKLRHVVIPSVNYRYQREPTVDKSRFFQLDSIDALERSQLVTLGLENKLQTKRAGESVDLASLLLNADHYLTSTDTVRTGFEAIRYDFFFKPYSSWEFNSDGDYSPRLRAFRSINSDMWGHFGRWSGSVGYRFKRDESSQITTGLNMRLNPFWSAGVYERFEFKTGNLVEQEYRLTRDMHCWLMEFVVNSREEEGVQFLLSFTLKAFPDIRAGGRTTVGSRRTA